MGVAKEEQRSAQARLPGCTSVSQRCLVSSATTSMPQRAARCVRCVQVGIASFVEYLLPVIMAQAFFLNVVLAGGAARNFIDRLFSDAGYLAE